MIVAVLLVLFGVFLIGLICVLLAWDLTRK